MSNLIKIRNMNTSEIIKLDPDKVTAKGIFVLVQKSEEYFEIGITRMVELQKDKKELKILLLTDSDFEKIPPTFDAKIPPFLPKPYEDVTLEQHPIYPIQANDVDALLALQKEHLQKNLPAKQKELNAFERLEIFLAELRSV